MFVHQKKLSVLNVPSSRVAMLYRSGTDIQLALPDLPSQMASAFMLLLRGGGKVQVLVGLHMNTSAVNLFYLSDAGEVAAERADQELEAGLEFAESMGFVLNDVEFNRMSAADKEAYWKELPICRKHQPVPVEAPAVKTAPATAATSKPPATTKKTIAAAAPQAKAAVTPKAEPAEAVAASLSYEDELNAALDAKAMEAKTNPETRRQRLREHLGRFLASL